jgi:hypothetical protein
MIDKCVDEITPNKFIYLIYLFFIDDFFVWYIQSKFLVLLIFYFTIKNIWQLFFYNSL